MDKKEAIQIELVTNGFLIRPAFDRQSDMITTISPVGNFFVFNELSGNALGSPNVTEFLKDHFQTEAEEA